MKNDEATVRQWADGAAGLVDVENLKGDHLFTPAEQLNNPGRSLDANQQGQITALIEKRIHEALRQAAKEPHRYAHSLKSLHLSLWLWDRNAGNAALLRLVPKNGKPMTSAMSTDDALCQVLRTLENCSTAVPIVLEELMKTKGLDSYMTELAEHYPLRMILRNADKAEYRELFIRIQSDPDSPWNFSTCSRKSLHRILTTGMAAKGMKFDFFTEEIVTLLTDTTKGIATLIRPLENPAIYYFEDTPNSHQRIPEGQDLAILPGEPMKLRRCDIAANAIARDIRPKTNFSLLWPKQQRDEVIDELKFMILKAIESQ